MPRFRNENGVDIPLTTEEETARDAEEAAVAAEQADYLANKKYKDDRKAAYACPCFPVLSSFIR